MASLAPADRFLAKIARGADDECWPWMGKRDRDGYGRFRPTWRGVDHQSHRFSWVLVHGPIPAGLVVCHACDNPPCCNPAHLFLGTMADNNRDRDIKQRTAHGERIAQAKLTTASVRLMRTSYAAGGVTQRELAVAFGVSPATVSYVTSGKRWRSVL